MAEVGPAVPDASYDADLDDASAEDADAPEDAEGGADATTPTLDRAAFCARIAGESAAVVRRAPRGWDRAVAALAKIRMGYCLGSTPWALAWDRVGPHPSDDAGPGADTLCARFGLVHALPDGGDARSSVFPMEWLGKMARASCNVGVDDDPDFGVHQAPRVVKTFDWDGDGDDEVVLAVESEGHEMGDRQARVFTFKGGRVVPYAPAESADVTEVRDVDGDGRPDLFTTGPYLDTDGNLPTGFRTVHLAAGLFLAHALSDGSFSYSDAVAAAHARRWCPATPVLDFHPDADFLEEAHRQTVVRAVLCARLRGRSATDVAAAIERECPCVHEDAGDAIDACMQAGTNACSNAVAYVKWARMRPPLQLR